MVLTEKVDLLRGRGTAPTGAPGTRTLRAGVAVRRGLDATLRREYRRRAPRALGLQAIGSESGALAPTKLDCRIL